MTVHKAILTGGGKATRLQPLTATINKHLLPLAGKPMIVHAIEKVRDAGITEIFINTNPGDASLSDALGDGSRYGVRIAYFEQTGGPQGIAHVVNEARRFIGHDPFLFYLSDNILLGDLSDLVREFEEKKHDCFLAFSRVLDPDRFGVPYFDASGALQKIVEKPKNPPNNLAVTGVYLYGPNIFFDAFSRIQKSPRGEYEISDIHSVFLSEGRQVGYKEITGWWKDTGKPEDLLVANTLLLDALCDSAFIQDGRVRIGKGTQVKGRVVFNGPVIVGEDCLLQDCIIGPYVTIGSGSDIRGPTMTKSIILDRVVIAGDFCLDGSILGKNVCISLNGGKKKKYTMIVGDKTAITCK